MASKVYNVTTCLHFDKESVIPYQAINGGVVETQLYSWISFASTTSKQVKGPNSAALHHDTHCVFRLFNYVSQLRSKTLFKIFYLPVCIGFSSNWLGPFGLGL